MVTELQAEVASMKDESSSEAPAQLVFLEDADLVYVGGGTVHTHY